MSERVLPPSTYYTVFGTLVVLTFLTIGISFLELGEWHTVAGLTIAVCKAMLVVLFFMHLLYSNRLTWIVLGGGAEGGHTRCRQILLVHYYPAGGHIPISPALPPLISFPNKMR